MKKLNILIILAAITVFAGHAYRSNALVQPSLIEAEAKIYKVKRVLNGKSFTLENGKTVRLASIQVPNIAELKGLKRAGEPMGKQSHQALIDLLNRQTITLKFGEQQEDRKGRLVGLAYLPDGRNVQAEMISQGWAVAYPFPDLRKPLKTWLKLEDEARKAKRGIWRHDYWKPRSNQQIHSFAKERYVLVEGVVKKAANVKGGWFLNFGEDWKTDFTGAIKKHDAKAYFKGFDLKSLEGKRVRLRGWVHRHNGPAIDLHQPEQIEKL